VHGTYSFALPDLAPGAIRELRDPDATDWRRRRRVNAERPISRRPSTPAAAAVFSSSALYRHWPFRCCSSPGTCESHKPVKTTP
jgi:hypothetical protein